jgi:hypothetical protein
MLPESLQKVLSVTRGVLFVAIGVIFVAGAVVTLPEDHHPSRSPILGAIELLRALVDALKGLF